MKYFRPRLNDYHGIPLSQQAIDFAIPFLNEDLPLIVDPFLLWKSPSQQDQSLHLNMMNSFRHILSTGTDTEQTADLILISECNEVGLGGSKVRKGKRISKKTASDIIQQSKRLRTEFKTEYQHLEEVQLFTEKISKDRVSDFACSLLKSFLIDYTIDQCGKYGIPRRTTLVKSVYDLRKGIFDNINAELPSHPDTGDPILLVPKRWLRYSPWISYEDYFENHYLKEYVEDGGAPPTRIEVLTYNRDNYDSISAYIAQKEKEFNDCKNDPLFKAIPILSAKRILSGLRKLPTGKAKNADMKYEREVCHLLPSLLYPHLDFADEQSRTISGTQIRDLLFYNNKGLDFLSDIWDEYNSRQIVFEIKNGMDLEKEHVNQLHRYLKDSFGSFGVFVTRNKPSKKIQRQLVDLWSGQRKCIVVLTDDDLEMMVNVFESKQRHPIEVIKMKYVEFMRSCPG